MPEGNRRGVEHGTADRKRAGRTHKHEDSSLESIDDYIQEVDARRDERERARVGDPAYESFPS